MQPLFMPFSEDAPGGAGMCVQGRYEILGEIARGGMGIVYLAQRRGEGGFARLFALKMMHPHLADQEIFARLMMREARLAARIHHPNVVGTVDFGVHEGSYFMVLDYVEGVSLRRAAQTAHRAPLPLVVSCVVDALLGLHAAHTLRGPDGSVSPILHLDVSPDNILAGVDGVGRIVDFGVAREIQQTTSAGDPRGKAAYMAPERLTGGTVDVRSDVWSMGVVLWNLLTGRRLFSSPGTAQTVYNILHQEIAPPSVLCQTAPEALDSVVLRALARAPERRFPSAADMAQALEQAAASADVRASRWELGAFISRTEQDELARRRAMIQRGSTLRNSEPPAETRGPNSETRSAAQSGEGDRPERTPPSHGASERLSQNVEVSASSSSPAVPERGVHPVAMLLAAICTGTLGWLAVRAAGPWDDYDGVTTAATPVHQAASASPTAAVEPPQPSDVTLPSAAPPHGGRAEVSPAPAPLKVRSARKAGRAKRPKRNAHARNDIELRRRAVGIEDNPYVKQE